MKRFRNICAIARHQKRFTFDVVNSSLCQIVDYQRIDFALLGKILKEKECFTPKIKCLSIQKTVNP